LVRLIRPPLLQLSRPPGSSREISHETSKPGYPPRGCSRYESVSAFLGALFTENCGARVHSRNWLRKRNVFSFIGETYVAPSTLRLDEVTPRRLLSLAPIECRIEVLPEGADQWRKFQLNRDTATIAASLLLSCGRRRPDVSIGGRVSNVGGVLHG
jgi:hypothetical protein